MKPILEIKNVSKKFQIFSQRKPYLSLRDKASSILTTSKSVSKDFWALNDVSFDVQPGDTIGLIGKNGAGKSTLLKILSKITPPTSGSIKVRGRIASLLEVGTGFHPELSGRENIYLNGSILGMKRSEINLKFDEIVDFSGVEQFLDSPLKYYSSGMQLRLAFAVAAFLEPEILVIDEVLAVGDMEFQKKCLRQMEAVSQSGRTILFVSHNMAAVKKLCSKGVLLRGGKVDYVGSINEAINRYSSIFDDVQTSFKIEYNLTNELPGFAYQLEVEDMNGNPFNDFSVGQPWQVRIFFEILRKTPGVMIALGILTNEDVGLRTSWSDLENLEPGKYEAVFKESTLWLGAGNYKLIVGLSSRMLPFQYVENAANLRISEEIQNENSTIKFTKGVGIVLNPMEIKINKLD
jgi:lipopolysaccharide transport system ATP-binding protein